MAYSCGSLTAYSGFNFEHINEELANICKGNKRFDLQIIKKINLFNKINNKVDNDSCSRSKYLVNLLNSRKWKGYINIDNIVLCGKPISVTLEGDIDPQNKYSSFKRALVQGRKVSTVNYSVKKKFNDSCFISKTLRTAIFVEDIILSHSGPSEIVYIYAKEYLIVEEFYYAFRTTGDPKNISFRLKNLFSDYLFAFFQKPYIFCLPLLECY